MATGKRTKPAGQLTNKQAAFVQEYLKDNNAAQAAMRAGFAESTARKQAHSWVGKNRHDCPVKYQHIWDAAQAAMDERMDRLKVDADYVLKKLVNMMEMSLKGAFDEAGNLKPLHEMPEEILDMVQALDSYEEFQGRGEDREYMGMTRKLKVTPKLEILKQIGAHIGVNAFRETVDVNVNLDVADAILKAAKCQRQTLMGKALEENDG